jgi:hypothetical protein
MPLPVNPLIGMSQEQSMLPKPPDPAIGPLPGGGPGKMPPDYLPPNNIGGVFQKQPPAFLGPPDQGNPQYKMGIGQRILGAANNFVSGLRGQGPTTYTGRGALNRNYYRDRANWQQPRVPSPVQTPPNYLMPGNRMGFRMKPPETLGGGNSATTPGFVDHPAGFGGPKPPTFGG